MSANHYDFLNSLVSFDSVLPSTPMHFERGRRRELVLVVSHGVIVISRVPLLTLVAIAG